MSISKAKEQYRNILLYEEPMSIKDLDINGNDIMSLGLQGKDVGKALTLCLETVLDNPNKNNKTVLIDIVKQMMYT